MALVQYTPTPLASQTSTGGTIPLSFTSNNTAGNCLVAFVTWYSFNSGLGQDFYYCTAVSDSQSNPGWTQVDLLKWDSGGQSQGCSVWVCFNCKAGANTVTGTINGTTKQRGIILAEYSNATSVVDHLLTNAAISSSTLTDGPITTTATSNQVAAFFVNISDATTMTAGSGYTQRAVTTSGSYPVISMETPTSAPSVGSTSATATCATTGRYAGVILALNDTSASSGGSAPFYWLKA
jgi:hypothetical protein